MNEQYAPRRIRVLADCLHELIPEDAVEILGIEENIAGEDVLTYRCPYCHAVHQSRRFG